MADVTDSKKPWQSKTILLNALMGVFVALAPVVPFAKTASDWINANGLIVGGVMAGLGVVLRWVTKGSVTLSD